MATPPYPASLSGSGLYPQFGQGQTASPFFNISNQFAPRNFHDVIKWSRYIITQSPTTSEVIRKHATYPITDFLVDSKNKEVRDNYEKIFRSLKLKTNLQDIGFDYYTLGNAFVSLYYPIRRILICPECSSNYAAKKLKSVKFKKFMFTGKCPNCQQETVFKVKDYKVEDVEGINIIKWAAENVSVNHNPITGESEYFYTIPNSVKRRIREGNRLFVDSVPWGFIEAVKAQQDFKFDSNNIFHLKNISMGSILEGLGMPPLISLYTLVFYQAVLRKANESIASEYLTPLRVVYPQPSGTGVDPVVNMSLQNFVGNVEKAFMQHKRDSNHILVAPMPLGYANLGGEGKSLLVAQEIEQVEETILLSLGVSKELLSGTTNWTSSTVGLRLLENTMLSYSSQITDLINWITTNVATYLNIPRAKVSMVPFKLTDDDNVREILMNLIQNGKASNTTLFESLGLDYNKEIERMSEEMVAESAQQLATQNEIKLASFLKTKQITEELEEDDSGYKDTLEQAQEIVAQLVQSPAGGRKSYMLNLQHQNPVLYAVVAQMMDEYNRSPERRMEVAEQEQQIAQQAQGQPGAQGQQQDNNNSAPAGGDNQ